MKDVSVIEVWVWGRFAGAVALDPSLAYYAFEYDPAWKRSGVELSPLHMSLKQSRSVYVFPALPEATYFRLPALLADALPDDFGNALIDAWMAQRGIVKSAVATHRRSALIEKWENRIEHSTLQVRFNRARLHICERFFSSQFKQIADFWSNAKLSSLQSSPA